jgi:hypothetical protein
MTRRLLPAALALLLAAHPAAGASPYHPPKVKVPPSGALLPWSRIVTYYGNPMSTRMGILGELPHEEMMARLAAEADAWRAADPSTPVRPGLELVATVASDKPGKSGLYRLRMPPEMIERVIGWARSRGWLTILDVQVGQGSVFDEVNRLRPFLAQPDVHLALDPEFDMPPHVRPGTRIGRTDAADINRAVRLLAGIVAEHKLPPKVLLVHRFTQSMVRRALEIEPDPRVQVVMVMDGYGPPALKRMVYRATIRYEPVQFAGIKLFYKNDRPLMTPREVLRLVPGPSVVIYQ